MEEGVEDDHADDLGGLSCILYLSEVVEEKDKRAYIGPDDTVLNAPLEAYVSGKGQMSWRVEDS